MFYISLVKEKDRGFTIIEVMVAIALFLVVVMYGMTALLNAGVVNQKTQDIRGVLDNLSFVMEDMSKNMRTGSDFQCFRKSTDPTSGGVADALTLGSDRSCQEGWAVAFEPANGNTNSTADQWVYYIDNNGLIQKSVNGSTYFPLTSCTLNATPPPPCTKVGDVYIDPVLSGFSVLGAEHSASGNFQQPLIKIRLTGTISSKNNTIVTPFSLQTVVSQRLLDS
jgi:prepilin-type N-terminal cleavage/methylation domain-containing protein